MQTNKRNLLIAAGALLIGGAALLFEHPANKTKEPVYYINQGKVFGTFYNIRYCYNESLEDEILERLDQFDGSLSMFNPHSTISVLNQGRDTVWDEDFKNMYACANLVNKLSHGAFDIRVAPLVDAWGFGKGKERRTPTQAEIDSLKQIRDHMDASAIAKGQGCDVVAELLESKGIQNYLVDIGGEVVAKGQNDKGSKWRVGINKPIDDITGTQKAVETVIETDQIAMATSGNYRQFYYDGTQKRSHTIDPRTGYPVSHNLLSATVTASSCMRADALATACMVLGVDSALILIENISDAECYLIAGTENGTKIYTSSGWKL